MNITFHGAARTVTGSQHLVEVNGKKILLDCGLYQGRRKEAYERNLNFGFDPAAVDTVVLSHAHIDHSGNIPNLFKKGFRGNIICTHATRDLAAVMLMDSGHIQERDVEYVNKRRRRRGEDPVEPLYTVDDACRALDCFESINYNRTRTIAPGVSLTFIDAGHMLGSATILLDIEDSDTMRDVRLVFSGDIGHHGLPIVRDPVVPNAADVLIMESTYGGRVHVRDIDLEKQLEDIINKTVQRNGAIIIPAFAVGRTQQLVHILDKLTSRGAIPKIPVYVDSPLATNATAVFRTHPEVYDVAVRDYMMQYNDEDPFGFQMLTYTCSVDESKALNDLKDSFIVISASGMMEHGRVLHHLKNRISDPRTTVLVTGWQAPHTLGRRLVEGEKTIRIFGEEYENRAQVEVLNGLSGHADHDELLAWVEGIKHKPYHLFLVHGEEDAANALKMALEERYTFPIDIPDRGESFTV
ncbi:MAG: MBL fold metallo-hydrolase [Chloroflexi bacterium]|nr:MAG: MBL fold metallo-hydrolase [Chloroflexota bacterium]